MLRPFEFFYVIFCRNCRIMIGIIISQSYFLSEPLKWSYKIETIIIITVRIPLYCNETYQIIVKKSNKENLKMTKNTFPSKSIYPNILKKLLQYLEFFQLIITRLAKTCCGCSTRSLMVFSFKWEVKKHYIVKALLILGILKSCLSVTNIRALYIYDESFWFTLFQNPRVTIWANT